MMALRSLNRKMVLPALLLISVFSFNSSAAAGWFGSAAEAKAKNAASSAPLPRVEVAVARHQDKVEQGLSTTSTIKAFEEVVMISKVTARVENLVAEKGDYVMVGEILAVLEHRSEEAQYESLKAQVAVARAELAQSKVSLADAQREFDRYSRLRKSGYATQQEYDTRSTTYQAAKASCAKAEAQLEQAQANLDAQVVTLKEYTLTSPIEGVVLDDYDMTAGALLKDSTNVFRIGQVNKLKAPIDIPERHMNRLRLGMSAELTFESLPGERFYGTVTLINPYIDTSTRTLSARISVDNEATGFKLKPGMFARVMLIEASETNPLVIPSEALRSDGTVQVVRNGKIEVQEVKTSVAKGSVVAVAEGLKAGEAVVVSGGNKLKSGDAVEMVESK